MSVPDPNRRVYCDGCGEDAGLARNWYPGEFKSCGSRECDQMARDADAQARDEARYQAEQDDYERYR